jgi:galactoside O-acetyltransferase
MNREELASLGFAAIGDEVHIDRTALFFGAEHIHLGSHLRIDAHCVIQAGPSGVRIGSYVHVAAGVTIGGVGAVEIQDFCGLSRNVAIFSSNDDYSGGAMTNPLVPAEFRRVTSGPVVLEKHTIVGSGSVIMPRVRIGLAAAVGALTLVNKNVPAFTVVSGNPPRKIGMRDRSILEREQDFLAGRHRAD